MQFNLTEDQTMIQESVRRFAESRLGPNARAHDDTQTLPAALGAELAELGLMGLLVDAEVGGADLDRVTAAVAIEELARYDGSVAAWVASHTAAMAWLLRGGSSDQKSTWLAKMAASEVSLACVTNGVEALADNRQWRLQGQARFVGLGTRAPAAIVRVNDETGFLVRRETGGVSVEPRSDRLGLRAFDVADWRFEGVTVTEEDRVSLGAESMADVTTLWAAVSVGLGRGAFEEARAYARERHQFGKPIAQFQAIQWKLADTATALEAARLMTYRAADALDRNRSDALTAATQARTFGSDMAVQAGYEAVQIFGGNGFVREYPVERFLRDAKVAQVAFR